MRNIIVTVGIFFLFLLCSCASLNEFPIEVYQPAKADLPPAVKNITLVSRNLKYTNDTLQNFYSRNYKLTKDIKTENIDSIAIKACFDSLSRKLEDQHIFGKVTVLPISAFPVKHINNINAPSRNQIQKIASDTNADVILLLDMFSGFYSIFPSGEADNSVSQVVTASIWTIYDPTTYRILHHKSMIDTLYWDGMDENNHYKASRIPNKKAAMEIAAGMVGANYSKYLLPHWTTVSRKTLSCNQTDFQEAAKLAKKNQWEQASAIWDRYTTSSHKRYRTQALYNLAVASEMEGNIENSIKLLKEASVAGNTSFHSIEMKTIRQYAAILAKRKVELNKINSMSYEE